MLGSYGARLDEIEEKVDRIQLTLDGISIDLAVKRGASQVERRILVTAGGFAGAVLAFLGEWLKSWLTRN